LHRLLDGGEVVLVERGDQQLAGLGYLEAGDLLHRHLLAVGLDGQALDQAGVARPVRIEPNSCGCGAPPRCIFSFASSSTSSMISSLTEPPPGQAR
jgi:hypothetical protein